MSKVHEIADDQDDILVRFDGKLVDRAALARLLDISALSDQDVRALADEIDRAVWNRVKHKYRG